MKPEPRVIHAEFGDRDYIPLLAGPPESVTMRSGAVQFQPGSTVGKHSTGNNEELLIIFEGNGLFLLQDDKQLEVKAGTVLYCPPETEHDIRNTGQIPLRYIYVVSKV